MLSEAACQKIKNLIDRYPERRSALIPSLWVAQREAGFLAPETICEIAQLFEMTPNEVESVVTFYTMFHGKPVGKYLIQVCTNISCLLCSAEELLEHVTRKLGIKLGETTADGKYTLVEVECLGSCGTSPVIQINDDYYENLTPETIDRILDGLQ